MIDPVTRRPMFSGQTPSSASAGYTGIASGMQPDPMVYQNRQQEELRAQLNAATDGGTMGLSKSLGASLPPPLEPEATLMESKRRFNNNMALKYIEQNPAAAMPQGYRADARMEPYRVNNYYTNDKSLADTENEATANAFQDVLTNINDQQVALDNAENVEQTLNIMRGDVRSIEERKSELAEYVGKDVVERTPDEVLAFTQPFLQMIDIVQKQSAEQTPGGIASAPMPKGGRQSTGNFSVAPGTQEAAERIRMGEEPVFRQDGSTPAGETGSMDASTPFHYVGKRPKFGSLSMADTLTDARTYYNNRKEFLPDAGGIDYRSVIDPFLQEEKTPEELMAEREEFFGDDNQNLKLQGYLSLMKYGSQVANTPGNLLQSITKPAGEFAEDLGKLASFKQKQEQQMKEASFNESRSIQGTNRNMLVQAALKSAESSAVGADRLEDAKSRLAEAAYEQGLAFNKSEVNAANDQLAAAWTANTAMSSLPSENYAKVENGQIVGNPISVRRRTDGLFYLAGDNSFKPLPEGYIKVSDAQIANQSTGLDFSKASAKNILVPDSTSISGMKQYAGSYLNGIYYYNPSGGAMKVAPAGFIEGTQEALNVGAVDDFGRVAVTITKGPDAGVTWFSHVGKRNEQTGELVRGPDGTIVSTPTNDRVAFMIDPAVRDDNGKLVSGNPMATLQPLTGVNPNQLSDKELVRLNRRYFDTISALTTAQDVLSAIPEAVGLSATLKAFGTNNLGMFFDDEDATNLAKHFRTEQARTQMRLFVREYIRANALNDRFAIAEQENLANDIYTATAEEVSAVENALKDSDSVVVQYQEMIRTMTNRAAMLRGTMNGTSYARIETVPTGTNNDPFRYGQSGHYDYLTIAAANGGRVEGRFLQFTPQEAKEKFPNNPSIWKNATGPIMVKLTGAAQNADGESLELTFSAD